MAVVTDANSNPVPNAHVAFNVPSSGASASLSTLIAISDSSGKVTVSATAGIVAGAYNAIATLQGVVTPATFALANVAWAGGRDRGGAG